KGKKTQLKTKKLQKDEDKKVKDNGNEDKNQKTLDSFRKRPMKEAMRTDPTKYDEEMYELIDENDLNLCGKRILRQAIEKPETAYKQINKLEKCQKMLEQTGDNTVNYTDPEARKSPNKEGIMQPGYNEQIMVDNKNGLIIAVDVTTAGNDNVQLKPMIQKTEETLSKSLDLTTEEIKEKLNGTNLLADNGYFNYEGIDFTENETEMTLYMPDKRKASKDKDKLRRPSQRQQKTRGYGKYNMTWDEENKCYICPEGEKLEMKNIYHKEYKDVIVYYATACANCPARNKCLTENMTTKVITDYASEPTEKLRYRMETDKAKEEYKKRMPHSESKFAHNKHNLNYRQYHVIGQEKALTQQLLMATAQNIIKIHNIEQQQIKQNQIQI
ncbi:MAG: transposase, partial [Methanosphaera sp.]|nr:transposase [Methanosphaera sp.]